MKPTSGWGRLGKKKVALYNDEESVIQEGINILNLYLPIRDNMHETTTDRTERRKRYTVLFLGYSTIYF